MSGVHGVHGARQVAVHEALTIALEHVPERVWSLATAEYDRRRPGDDRPLVDFIGALLMVQLGFDAVEFRPAERVFSLTRKR